MKSNCLIILLLFLISLLVSCESEEKLYERKFHIMGSALEIKLYSKSKETFIKVSNQSIKRAKEIDYLFSNYKNDSVLALVNREAGKRPVKVPEEFIKLTKLSKEYSEKTDGSFDITIGNLFELWKLKAKQDQLPTKQEIDEALKCTGYEKIKLDEENYEISFDVDCLKLDYGAIGKGYVVDKIIKIAKANGIKRGLVNFGGNIYALSSPYGSRYWKVGIRKPRSDNEILSSVKLKDMGVATSGDYEKYFEIKGSKYSHILVPKTGYPVKDISSITVVSGSAIESDVYSTAISVLGYDTFKIKIMENDLGVLFITKKYDGLKFIKSENFKKIEVKN